MGKSGGARKGKQWRTPKTGQSAFRAPTSGLEDKVFMMGTVEAAETFDEVRELCWPATLPSSHGTAPAAPARRSTR